MITNLYISIYFIRLIEDTVRMCTIRMPGARGGCKREQEPMEVELQMVVSLHEVAGTQTRVPSKISKCS